ncbi:hypothetical protein METBIDRAFT_116343 [Metschnikowia bicuspidata var. bicuspidata NRRL YB-4993]|uniref:Uncharacterized protein n=1 Tax=Metschnikowia bicuspidata var. bicuspidata NRRL YB-4993 TaxID=869754 RepID=A0A1A0HJG4_9ASCO|nr:hypothetical protein METBIDRAFT_116343 [Metschnikowia bicuspidata var. bicuspidata NRRL YB-4993]OBA24027.1 hypothetical protein METBIDRAFT_116343 [Metschnikowia bicuspidata var. bicuspidata NRRL YB-4993]
MPLSNADERKSTIIVPRIPKMSAKNHEKSSSEITTESPSLTSLKRIRLKACGPIDTESSIEKIDSSQRNFLLKYARGFHFNVNQTRRVFENKSKRDIFFELLNSLPEDDLSIKLDVQNPCGVSAESMEKALDRAFMVKKDKYVKAIRLLVNEAKIQNKEMRGEKTQCGGHEVEPNQMRELVSSAVACIFIANAKFVNNKVYLIYAKSLRAMTFIASRIAPDFHKSDILTEQEVINKIHHLVFRFRIFEEGDPDNFFILKKLPVLSGRLAWTTVSFLPMENPEDYFSQSFLYPEDVVTSWITGETNSRGKVFADVIIDLGREKTPPRRLTMDRTTCHLQHVLSTNKFDGLIAEDKKRLSKMLEDNNGIENSTTKSLTNAISRAEVKAAIFKARVCEVIAATQQQKTYDAREDHARMTCVVQFKIKSPRVLCAGN